MTKRPESNSLGLLIGSVWVFHGLYSKILNRIPRHRQIVARVLGEEIAVPATAAIGAFEILLGVWAWSGRKRKACALTQTLTLCGMNSLEISRAKDLLISTTGMLALNAAFLATVWSWARPALQTTKSSSRKFR